MMLDGVTIRAARADDLPACAGIINDYIDATDWLPRDLPRNEIAALFEPGLLDRRTVLVAEAEGRIFGYLSMGEDGFVPALYLAPPARGRGIGKAILDVAKALRPEGIELTVFVPNAAAQRFYAREGFRSVPGGRVTEIDEGIPTLRLRWEGMA